MAPGQGFWIGAQFNILFEAEDGGLKKTVVVCFSYEKENMSRRYLDCACSRRRHAVTYNARRGIKAVIKSSESRSFRDLILISFGKHFSTQGNSRVNLYTNGTRIFFVILSLRSQGHVMGDQQCKPYATSLTSFFIFWRACLLSLAWVPWVIALALIRNKIIKNHSYFLYQ